MSKRRGPNETTPRAPGALRVLIGAIAVVLLVGYPLGVREVLQTADAHAPWVVALVKVPPVLIGTLLASAFLSTLAPGREPMIARFARMERGALPADLSRYTRRLTMIWGGMFIAMVIVCLALSTPATTAAWRWWTGIGQWVCVAVLFIGERVYRKRRFPHYVHASLVDQVAIVVRQWRA